MAQKILVGPNYFEDFTNGQGVGATNYFTYAQDMDTSLATLRTTINQMIDELNAVQGTNALLGFDLAIIADPDGPFGPGQVIDMLIGEHSYKPELFSTNTVTIRQGVAIVQGIRVNQGSDVVLINTFPAGTEPLFVRIEPSGTPVLTDTAGGAGLDAYQLGVVAASQNFEPLDTVQLAFIGPSGDNHATLMRRRTAVGSVPTFPVFSYRSFEDRLLDTERLLAGFSTGIVPDLAGTSAPVLGPIGFGGTVGQPGLSTVNPATGVADTSGFYRAAINQPALSVLGTQALRWAEVTADEPASIFRAGTLLAEPPIAWNGDLNTGFGWISADEFRAIAGGNEAARFFFDAVNGQLGFVDGAVGTPGLVLQGDRDTGFYGTGTANELALATLGIQAALWNAQQQRTSATQGRASATRTTQNIATGTALVNVVLNTAEQHDQGAYHDLVTNPDRMTVPAGHAGVFQLCATCSFDESSSVTPNVGDRDLAITVNGIVVARDRKRATVANDTDCSVSIERELVATDIVRMAVAQDSGNAMNVVNSLLTVRLGD